MGLSKTMGPVIEVSNLVKRFGEITALDGVSFTVGSAEVFGIIGPNGAGKTTALRILATLLLPTSGVAKILGYDVVKEPEKVRPLISYLAEDAGAYRNLSGYEYLRMVADIYYRSRAEARPALEEAVEITGIGDRIRDLVKTYSKGMKRRLQVARVFLTRPRVAILDEPTAGLDVIHAQYVRSLIKRFSQEFSITAVVSSHNMLEVEHLCSRIILMHRGTVVAEGGPREVMREYGALNLEEAFVKAIGGG